MQRRILTPYQGKREKHFNQCRDAYETYALWRHTEEIKKCVLIDAETHAKHMRCDAMLQPLM